MKQFILLLLLTASSCSILTKSQIQAVQKLSLAADTISNSPSLMFQSLSQVRKERGVFYASSFTSPTIHENELYDVATAYTQDIKMAAKMDAYSSVLNSYIRALKSLSSPSRHEQIGTEIRGIGRNIDSIIIRYNQLEIDDKIPTGFAKVSGKYAAYLTETYMKYRQTALLKDYITESDTLVAQCVDSIVDLLRNQELDALFLNEKEGLRANYLTYLNASKTDGASPNITSDRKYTDLIIQLSSAEQIRKKCISGLNAFKRAHHKLISRLDEKSEIAFLYDEFLELASISAELNKLIKSN